MKTTYLFNDGDKLSILVTKKSARFALQEQRKKSKNVVSLYGYIEGDTKKLLKDIASRKDGNMSYAAALLNINYMDSVASIIASFEAENCKDLECENKMFGLIDRIESNKQHDELMEYLENLLKLNPDIDVYDFYSKVDSFLIIRIK